MKKATILATGIILLAFSATQANIFWTNSSGSGGYFDWQNGQSLYGLFGDPIFVGDNTFVFFPSNFRAESVNGVSDSVSDRLEFELIAHEGFSFQNISVIEYGDYGILGDGQVQVSGGLTVENMDTANSLFGTITATPSMPAISGQGAWQGQAQLGIGQIDWTRIKITFEDNLLAMSGDGSSSFIEKKVLGNAIAFQITPIPEPATVITLTIGAIFIFRDFRKKPAAA
ncbi:MAG: hypothetical protein WC496_00860 [Phycisphaerae bacterium]|jgi:hypothetical protein